MADEECDGCSKLRNGMARKGGERRVEASRGGEGRASEHGAEDRQGAGQARDAWRAAECCKEVSKGGGSRQQPVAGVPCGNERMEQEKKKEDKSIDLNLPVGFNSPATVGGRL